MPRQRMRMQPRAVHTSEDHVRFLTVSVGTNADADSLLLEIQRGMVVTLPKNRIRNMSYTDVATSISASSWARSWKCNPSVLPRLPFRICYLN